MPFLIQLFLFLTNFNLNHFGFNSLGPGMTVESPVVFPCSHPYEADSSEQGRVQVVLPPTK